MIASCRFLANDLQLPLICAGTADAKRALMTDRQLADRFEAVELPAWHNDDAYGRLLASFLGILPLRQRSDLLASAVRRTLLEQTEGVTVRLVRLIEILAIDAIRSGRERINQESLAALSSLAPLLSMEDHSHASFTS